MTGNVVSSCALVGSDSLLIECGEILLREGHEIACVMTDTDRVAQWARERNLAVVDPTGDHIDELRAYDFDWLFSITWLSILPEEVLKLAKSRAVNFHDGPLPAYAGLHTPAWAIMNGEREYGVTWHVMTAGVDEGELLAQRRFEVAEAETSLTINTRCFEAALESFEELIDGLATGTTRGVAQDSTQRSYFGKFDRPAAACTIDWTRPATEIEALVRALDFGRYPNALGTPKIHVGGETCSVTSAALAQATGAPGTILAVHPDHIRVAAGEGALDLTAFAWSCGRPATPPEIAQTLQLVEGTSLDQLTEERARALDALNHTLARSESFWLQRLTNLEVAVLPSESSPSSENEDRVETPFEIPHAFRARFADHDESEFVDALTFAFTAFVARLTCKPHFHVAFRDDALATAIADFEGWTASEVPLQVAIDFAAPFAENLSAATDELATVRKKTTWLRDLTARRPELAVVGALPIAIHQLGDEAFAGASPFCFCIGRNAAHFAFDRSRFPDETVGTLAIRFATFLESVATDAELPIAEHAIMQDDERERLLFGWNDTAKDYDSDACVHHLFEAQTARTPDAAAVAFGDSTISYRELNEQANRLAAHLRELGVGEDRMVGIHLERSIDLMVAVLGTLKAGGAYLPLDPAFPTDRIAFMLEDAGAPVIVTSGALARSLSSETAGTAHVVRVDDDHADIARHDASNVARATTAGDLAYVIYTSGSTGKPKGVMVEHCNAVNFFAGMDERIGADHPGVWLAVTSLSFDISVLELLWTVCRGYEVVIYSGVQRGTARRTAAVDFGLSFFASNAGEKASEQYQLLLDSARYADANGFASIWTPERHFHEFGGLYPNPAVTSAALAAVTERIKIRCGSVVVPLHHPVRVAEEWSLVDNLSNGRVGIAAAAGWHPNDFVLRPENYEDRKQVMVRDLETIQRLWRGETVELPGPKGTVQTKLMPRPVQPELPMAITAAGNPDTFREAGARGHDVLTHLLGQSVEELAAKLDVYREARRTAGHAGDGHVTIMLHTYVGDNIDEIREIVREPLRNYLRSAVDLIKNHVSDWSAVKKSVDGGSTPEIGSLEELEPEDVEALLDFAFERYFETSALFGTPETCVRIVEELHAIGIDEITCLIDFGVPSQQVFKSLPHLNQLRIESNRRLAPKAAPAESIDELIERHGVTHLQCTPSMATMLVEDDSTRRALGRLDVMMVGGEALPVELARKLTDALEGRLLNMYGPTETTIWSSTALIESPVERVTLGTPIANTSLYVLDDHAQPVPAGVYGELWIGGDGVTRGYHERPELTAERFADDPFRPGARMYRTGDVARWLENGEVEFAGRVDHQVKVRGYRIELGEIESVLNAHADLIQAVVVTSGAPDADVRIVGYGIARDGSAPTPGELQDHLRAALPEYMVPTELHLVETFPLTPNGKIDRNALSDGVPVVRTEAPVERTRRGLEPKSEPSDLDIAEILTVVRDIWVDVLGVSDVGMDENFFDLGGHSLLTIRVQKALRDRTGVSVPLVDMFRFTTVRSLAESLAQKPEESGGPSAGESRAALRAAKRRRRAS